MFLNFKKKIIYSIVVVSYLRYRTDGYSPNVAHSVATCSAIRSICAKRADDKLGEYKTWNVSGESSENICFVWMIEILEIKFK